MKKKLLRILGPDLSRIIESLICAVLFLRQPRNFEIATLVAGRREYFRGFQVGAIFLVAQLPPKEVFEYTRIQSLLVNGVVTASSHAL